MTTDQPAKVPSALWLGAVLVISAGCLFATQDAMAKHLSESYSPFQVAWMRFALHAGFIGLWLRFRGHPGYLQTRRPALQFLRALALVGVIVSMYWSVSIMSLAQATVIQFLSPIVVTLLSVFVLGERIYWRRSAAILAGFAGVVIVLAPDIKSADPWLFLPCVTAISLAVFVMLTQQLSDPREALPALGLMPIICAVILLPVLPFVWQIPLFKDLPVIMLLALNGAIAHLSLQAGLRFAPASVMAPFLYVQVICAAGLSVLFFADPLGPRFVVGALFIIGSGVAIWWLENHARRVVAQTQGEHRR